jgi:Predicted transcriptional regulator
MSYSILRLPAVKARTGLSRSTIYLRISQGTFPARYSLGARAVGWLESEISAWIANTVATTRDNGAVKS